MRNLMIVLGILIVIMVLGLGAASMASSKAAKEKAEAAKEETLAETESTKVEEVDQATIDANPVATIEIEGMEPMQFVLFPEAAPQSVYNFISLANSGFYEGLTMHRIVTGFVAQGGDETGTGAGPTDYTIKGEFPSNGVETGLTHKKGALAWARSTAPDSAGTQFYVCLEPQPTLDKDYAVFGYMISGEEALDQLEAVSSTSGTPTEDVIIKSVSVDTKGKDYPEPDKL